jgi:plastocyanin
MKKLVLLAFAVLAVAASSSVSAATTTMAITPGGYVPGTLTVATGDSVVFANQDTVAHQVVLKPTTGFTCTANLVIQPGQSSTCTFRTVTKYSVSDPNKKGAAFKGTINVTAGPPGSTLSLTAAPKLLLYARSATLSGQLASGQANQKVDVFTQECGAAALTKFTTASTTTGGAYTLTVQPHRNTTFQARFRSSSSSQVLVKVRPRVTLRKLAPRKFRATVLAADSYAGKFVLFQRYSSLKRRWITIRSVVLRGGSTLTTPINPTTVSTATFRARVKVRLRVRAYLTQAQAGSCYAASASAAIRS